MIDSQDQQEQVAMKTDTDLYESMTNVIDIGASKAARYIVA